RGDANLVYLAAVPHEEEPAERLAVTAVAVGAVVAGVRGLAFEVRPRPDTDRLVRVVAQAQVEIGVAAESDLLPCGVGLEHFHGRGRLHRAVGRHSQGNYPTPERDGARPRVRRAAVDSCGGGSHQRQAPVSRWLCAHPRPGNRWTLR